MPSEVDLTKAADQCVMCGMCLPHCPTYQVSQHEAESPRGRISLVKAFSEGQLSASESLESHLQSCTGCMKCQQVCPANVPYQNIIDHGRSLYRKNLKCSSRLLQKISIAVLTHQWGHQLLTLSSAVVKHLPLKHQATHLLRLMTPRCDLETTLDNDQSIIILPGCTGALFDQQTLTSIVKILTRLNINANIPDEIMCCGALAQHSGYLQQAEKQATIISDYLSKQKTTGFVSFASGCGRQLNEHVANSQHKHSDIISWLAKSTNINSLHFESSAQQVLVHMPCTLKDKERDNVIKLLNLIPNIRLLEFNDGISCCGAGGMQLMSPEDSNRSLMDRKINTIETLKPDVIVTSNIGCSLSLKLGLKNAGLDINVIHPVTLLAQQLKN
ncbi:MAG: (Fe-S)-binding protein [Gammaproteobacteria bacterium]